MSNLSADCVTLTLDYTDSVGWLIHMRFGNQPYVMLTVKGNILAAKLVVQLEAELEVKDVIIGMAFDYAASEKAEKLVLCSDPTVSGIYVPLTALKGQVAQMLKK
jgi:hypothetical protein